MLLKLLIVLVLSCCCCSYAQQQIELRRNSGPETMDIIAARGFAAELFLVRSPGGSLLSVYRIINPLANQASLNPIPVLIFHGVANDASSMVARSDQSRPRRPIPGQVTIVPGSDDCLAFMLSNNNHDVYLVDARGSNLNNRQASADLNPIETQRYWNFSLDNQALNDLPALVDFLLLETGSPKLHYISYSESTFFMFALLSARPEYQEKLASFTALAPVAYVSHLRGTGLTTFLSALAVPEGVEGNFVPTLLADSLGAGVRHACSNKLLADTLCAMALSSLAGSESLHNPTEFFISSFKSTSIKSIRHFMQLYKQQRFGMYDYGTLGNMKQYSRPFPPNYELANIKLPFIILIRGSSDYLSTPEDQARLLSELGTRPYLDIVLPKYGHLDFLLAESILEDVNLPIVRTIHKLNIQFPTGGHNPPRRHRPISVARPKKSREISTQAHLASNLLDGLADAAKLNTQTLGLPPVASDALQRSFGVLTRVGTFTDNLNTRLSSLTGRVLSAGNRYHL